MGTRLPAVFMRGGTSKGLILHQKDLPLDLHARDRLLLAIMGSPDPYGRQLDGMGGGISSLSKVCIVGPPSVPDADVDYLFAQIMVDRALVDTRGNCGNMASAIGPFAIDEGLVAAHEGHTLVRIHNVNTSKIIHAHVPVKNGRAQVRGPLKIPGVPGTGAEIRLEFMDPGGAASGKLLPTGQPCDTLDVPGTGRITASLVDAANACVFIQPQSIGLKGDELPEALEQNPAILQQLEAIRQTASQRMGIARSPQDAQAKPTVPFICMVSPPRNSVTLQGHELKAADMDILARALSSGQPHRALQLTVSLCLAVAAQIKGTLVQQCVRTNPSQTLRIGMPSGILLAGAEVLQQGPGWHARRGFFSRTARRLFEGFVYAGPGV